MDLGCVVGDAWDVLANIRGNRCYPGSCALKALPNGLSKVSVEMDQKPLTPWSTNMAAVQMGNSLDFVALRAKVSRAAASSLAYADG
jgi:hypothetical protein